MSNPEKRAWLALCTLVPAYLVYFTLQAAMPATFDGMPQRIALLAVAAALHGAGYGAGLLWMRRSGLHDLHEDERDRAIDARATRGAYSMLLTGMVIVGMVLPFDRAGWEIVNPALFVVVIAEALRQSLVLLGYRRPRLAY